MRILHNRDRSDRLIVLMDRINWAAPFRMGVRRDRLVWLGTLLPGRREISDPFGVSDQAADEIVDMLHAATESLATAIDQSIAS